jgi:curved DNA-binding protein
MLRTLRPCFGFAVQAFNPAKNYYKILEIEETAQQDRIKASFKSLAKRYHPDVNKGKEEQFKEVNEAYQVLSD